VALAVLTVCGIGQATAQSASRQELAGELARVILDETARRGLDEQVSAAMVRGIGANLQSRLTRPLLDVEWRMLADIVTRFIAETLPPSRTAEIAAQAYARYFDEAELRELLGFQRSAVGRKAARLTPVIGSETAQAIDAEIRESAGMPRLLEELQRAFPVLKLPQSP
jgi:hypothetical protein